jgi:hypothetical protein
MVPVMLVFVMIKDSNFLQNPSSVGMVPLMLVYRIDTSSKSFNAPIPGGIVPVISEPSMVRYSKCSLRQSRLQKEKVISNNEVCLVDRR